MAFVKNLGQFDIGIDLFMKKVEQSPVQVFRWMVWEVFCEILEQTPQWSGKAVANWNIGVGAPDYTWDDSLGEPDTGTYLHNAAAPLVKHDPQWIEVAKFRNLEKLNLITRRERVYITNSVMGDDDKGGQVAYLAALQDPVYWQQKLRAANKPYEVATETMVRVISETQINGLGSGIELARIGGLAFGDEV